MFLDNPAKTTPHSEISVRAIYVKYFKRIKQFPVQITTECKYGETTFALTAIFLIIQILTFIEITIKC